MGVRTKLFMVSFLILLGFTGGLALWIDGRMATWHRGQATERLQRMTTLAGDVLAGAEGPEFQRRLEGFAHFAELRLTLFDASGAIVADTRGLRPKMGNPVEVKGLKASPPALGAESPGSDFTTEPWGTEGAVLRATLPGARSDEAAGALWTAVLITLVGGFFVALFMTALAGHLASGALRRLVRHTRGLAEGDGPRRIDTDGDEHGEYGLLAGSFNRMAAELDRTVTTLAAERARSEVILSSMREAVLAIDETGVVTQVNDAALTMLGLDESPVGRPFSEVVDAPALMALVAGDGPGDDEFDLPGEPPRRLLAHTAPLRGRGGNQGCVLGMADVTEMRHLERVRRDFVANVSHELRTPVSVVRANAETLLSGALDHPKHARRFTEAIERNAERLTRLISDLLDLSRIEAGQFPVQSQVVDILDAARAAVDGLSVADGEAPDLVVEAWHGGISISTSGERETALWALADPRALHHVLTNLLENARKYGATGEHIRVRAFPVASTTALHTTIRVEVEDDGPGIELRHRERIFERFFRVDKGRNRNVGGTGLGLAIVKHLVETLGGEVGVEPAPSGGAIFWFTLPAAREGEVDVDGPRDGTSASH